MIAAILPGFSAIFVARSARSTWPSWAEWTVTTFSPAIAAEAALVPCADEGIRQTLRSWSARDS